jgi:hypothetical protein
VIYAISSESVYSSSQSARSILEINAISNSVIGQIILPLGSDANAIAFDPVNRELYYGLELPNSTSAQGGSELVALNTVTYNVSATLLMPVYQISVDELNNRIFVATGGPANESGNSYASVAVLSGAKNEIQQNLLLQKTNSSLGYCCYEGSMVYDPITNFLYQSLGTYFSNGEFQPDNVGVNLTSGEVFQNLTPTQGTSDYAIDSTSGIVFVTDNGYMNQTGVNNKPFIKGGNTVDLLYGNELVKTYQVQSPLFFDSSVGSVACDPTKGWILVADGSIDPSNGYRFVENTLSILNETSGNALFHQFTPDGITALFLDPVNEDIYIVTPSYIYATVVTS